MAKKDEKTDSTASTEEPQTASTGTEGKTEVTTTPDYESRFKSFEKTISEQGQQLKDMGEFVNGATTVINTLASDPNLTQAFRESLARQQGVQTQQQNQTQDTQSNGTIPQNQNTYVDRRVDEVVKNDRNRTVKDFEHRFGIDQLQGEEQRQVRGKVATYLGGFGWDINTMPLDILSDSLDKAYMGSVGLEKLKEEGRLEGVLQARNNAQGVMGAFGGGAPNEVNETGKLTDKQKDWMNKLRVRDIEGAEKLYNDRDNDRYREKDTK